MKTAKVEKIPRCDFCEKEAVYDAKTRIGCWAYMCETCWKNLAESKTLGLGVGQKLIQQK